jgi:UDP-2,4-diacetamido-2,4,6-trideoxy-beta-L-altropyranose hydrolase
MSAPLTVFRCDASPIIGAGHVTRCLALAEALADAGWRPVFAVRPETEATVTALPASGFEMLSLDGVPEEEAAEIGRRLGQRARLVVVDHYGRSAAFETACRAWAERILVFDDGTGRVHDCDLLVDAAASGEDQYCGKVPPYAKILAGARYAMLRRSFLQHRPAALARRDGRPVRNILVSLGASDIGQKTASVLNALAGKYDAALTVVTSSRARSIEDIRHAADGRTRVLVDVADVAPLMADADLAIGAAGATAYERAVLGLPSVIVALAENQKGVTQLLCNAGAALDGGTADIAALVAAVSRMMEQTQARVRMAEASSQLVDGQGPRRVLWKIAGGELARSGSTVILRQAETADQVWLLDLQQQPETRRFFRNPAIPTPHEHATWLRVTLADDQKFLAVIESDGERVGVIRLDCAKSEGGRSYEISIALMPSVFNRGIGSAALRLVQRLFCGKLVASVFPENVASKRLFLAAGFVEGAGAECRLRIETVS